MRRTKGNKLVLQLNPLCPVTMKLIGCHPQPLKFASRGHQLAGNIFNKSFARRRIKKEKFYN